MKQKRKERGGFLNRYDFAYTGRAIQLTRDLILLIDKRLV